MTASAKKSVRRKAPAKKVSTKKAAVTNTKKAPLKTALTKASVSAFLNAVEHEQRRRDAKAVLAMMKRITGQKPKMWGDSIVGFGEYHYRYESGREGDMLNVGFSPRKANLVLYVMGSIADDDPLRSKLGKYKTGRACLYVNKLDDIDLAVLEKIIEKSFKKTIERWGA